jgi:ABC-type uncharacterized transport system YnjBCD ATPase subunit
VEQSTILAQALTEQLVCELPASCLEIARAAKIADLLFEPAAEVFLDPKPRVRTLSTGQNARAALHDALTEHWLQVARERVLLIAVDDIESVDEPSGAWLATLATRLRNTACSWFAALSSRRAAKIQCST